MRKHYSCKRMMSFDDDLTMVHAWYRRYRRQKMTFCLFFVFFFTFEWLYMYEDVYQTTYAIYQIKGLIWGYN